jgi:hypothetical protein
MARNHARILTSIWNDSDFLRLSPNAQWVYLMLVSEPTLTHAGVLSITARRWARRAKGATAELIMDGIYELAAARYVVIDEDTEELLVRSLIRNDGVWKQPKILACAIDEAATITSPELRTAVVAELDRIDPSGLSDKVKPDVVALLGDLPEALEQARPHDHPEDPAQPPFDPPPNGPPQGGPEGARGRGEGIRTGGITPASVPGPRPEAPRAQPRPTLLGVTLLDEHLKACAVQPTKRLKQRTGEVIDRLLDEGVDPDHIRGGLGLMRSRPGKGPGLLEDLVHDFATALANGNVTPLPATGTDGRTPPRTGALANVNDLWKR